MTAGRKRTDGRRWWRATAVVLALCGGGADAWAQCKPLRPRPPVILTTMGACSFNPATMGFAGTPAAQAACLLRPVERWGRLGPVLPALPAVLAERVGREAGLPAREALWLHLTRAGLFDDFAARLWDPVARAEDNDPDAPAARYLVIHDTSSPFLGVNRWPADLDTNRRINSLARYRCEDGWESAHVFINRTGDVLLGHDLAVPWRATKFERAINFGTMLKGLFLHVELVQPRRSTWRRMHGSRRGRLPRGRRNDALAPVPGFSAAQYDRLALIYTVASVRAGHWLIPAFHAVIDNHIRGGHDDPQNFDLPAFADSLARLLATLATDSLLAAKPVEPVAEAEPLVAAFAPPPADRRTAGSPARGEDDAPVADVARP